MLLLMMMMMMMMSRLLEVRDLHSLAGRALSGRPLQAAGTYTSAQWFVVCLFGCFFCSIALSHPIEDGGGKVVPELTLEYRMAAELLGRGVSKDHMFQWASCNDRVADCYRKVADFDSEYAIPLLYLFFDVAISSV
jgi:hypothetical protein